MKRKPVLKIFLLLLLAYSICLAIYVYNLESNSKSGSEKYTFSKPAQVSESWKYRWDDSVSLKEAPFPWFSDDYDFSSWKSYNFPGRPPNPEHQRGLWITAKLPSGHWGAPTLRFRAPQQSVEVYLDGERIYTFGNMDFQNVIDTPGSIWHFVTLPDGFQGKNIFFRTYSPVSYLAGYLIEIEVGEKSDHIINILKKDGKSLILGSLFVFIGILALFVSTASSRYRKMLISLGFFSLCIGLWSIAEGKILQLFIDSPVIPVYIANFSIFLMPSGFISFVQLVFTDEGSLENTILKRLWQSYIALTGITFLLDMLKIQSSLEMDKFLHLLIIVSIPTLLFVTIKAIRKGNKDALIFLAGLLALASTGIIDIYMMFYFTSPSVNPQRISDWGMLLMVLSLIGIIVKKLVLLNEQLRINSLENETNYKSLFKNMTEGFIYSEILYNENRFPADYLILDTNPAFIANTGMTREQIIGRKMSEFLPEFSKSCIKWGQEAQEDSAACTEMRLNEHLNFREKWYKASAFSPKGGYICIMLSDITEMKNAENVIRHQAYTDSMTGFYNRTYFEDVMSRMGSSMDELKPISIMVIDIDGLKITNDTFGHRTGDELLVYAAGIISEVFKNHGIITRVGGDEFCIILYDTDYETVSSKRDMIAQLVDKTNISDTKVPISMSMGIATCSKTEEEDIYNIYRRADDDMYQYKLSQASSEKSKLIDMLLTALAERDYVSQGHVERLVLMAECMSDALGLQDIQKRNLILLAKVHDLGKIGISDKVLFKCGKLSKEEYELMKQHVKIGFNIANRSKELIHIAALILHHHEHWDGNGYPEGLSGRQIPLECRILGVIDAYDAMTNLRPYHKGITKKDAVLEIKRCSGTQFDPEIVESFIKISELL